jgi:hypothetical protein
MIGSCLSLSNISAVHVIPKVLFPGDKRREWRRVAQTAGVVKVCPTPGPSGFAPDPHPAFSTEAWLFRH